MEQYIRDFCREFDYPEGAADAFADCWKKIQACPEAKLAMDQAMADYERLGTSYNPNDGLRAMQAVTEAAGAAPYTMDFTYYLVQTKTLRRLYEDAKLPYKLFYDSVSDMKWKLRECQKMYGQWGSFVAGWFGGFFTLSRFAFGRLQLELSTWNVDKPYVCQGRTFPKGTRTIGMHIPSCGPLHKEECMDSFRQAWKYYRGMFNEDLIMFNCYSWLLFEKHREFLPKTSNILMFMDFFDIVESHDSPQFGDCWRIFNRKFEGSVEGFPRDTSLQRAYYDWVASGHAAGFGCGAFLFDGEKIYHSAD